MKKNYFKHWMMITIIVSLAGIWPEIGSAQEARKSFSKGTEYLRQGELDKAKDALEDAISLKPNYAEAYNNLGLVYYEKEDYNEAELKFKKVTEELNPNDENAWNNLAILYYKQGRIYDEGGQDYQAQLKYNLAVTAYNTALSLSTEEKPYHADVYNNLGVIYAKKGDYINAENAYTNAIRIAGIAWDDVVIKDLEYTKYTRAYYNRGNLYYEQKKYDQAITDYDETIAFYEPKEDIDYDYSDAYYNKGLCYFNKNQYDQAIAEYQNAININPGFIWAHYSKGYVHFLKKEYSQALAEFQQVLSLPNDFRAKEGAHSYAQLGMGLVYHKQGEYEQSLEKVKASCSLGNASACSTLRDLGQL